MKEHTKAYIAGLMDAEGCFTIARNTSSYGTPHYEPCMALTSNSQQLAPWLVETFGGMCLWKQGYKGGIAYGKPWFQWKFSSYQHAQKFLSSVKPYLVLKLDEAKVLEEFYTLYRQEVPEKREELCIRIKGLKNKESVTANTPTFLWSDNLVNAYFAGFFDGEGTTGVNKNGKGLKPRLRISLFNTSEPILQAMQKRYSGAVYSRGRRQPHHQPIWAWQLDKQKQQESFLLKMLPYLIIKRDVAKESLEWLRKKKIESELTGDSKSVLVVTQAA